MDYYGYARVPEKIDHIKYGRFRNVYLYITEKCHLNCGHCYLGERLERGITMPLDQVIRNLILWRKMGGSKLSILGGEPTLHPNFEEIIQYANKLGYEKVILNTHALRSAINKIQLINSSDFSYVQVSLDGASSKTHDRIRGKGTFDISWEGTKKLCDLGFDTRIICTVNRINIDECFELLPMADEIGASLVKFHVFSGIGNGNENEDWLVSPPEWIEFYEKLESYKNKYKARIWYQPTYAKIEKMNQYSLEGYSGCIGRTLDRISIFPDGKAYVCSYLFDTELNYLFVNGDSIETNKNYNEFELFTKPLIKDSCGSCKISSVCMGGCPAEKVVMGESSCISHEDIVPVCRLWKSDI